MFRERHPDVQAFTWWDYRGGAFHKREGLRIDLLLATRPVLERVRAVEIDREYRKKQAGLTASDHAPVFADLASTSSQFGFPEIAVEPGQDLAASAPFDRSPHSIT